MKYRQRLNYPGIHTTGHSRHQIKPAIRMQILRVLGLLLLWLPLNAPANNGNDYRQLVENFPAQTTVIHAHADNVEITSSAWIEDTEDNFTLNQLLHEMQDSLHRNQGDTLNFGHSDSSFWVGFKLRYEPGSDAESKRTFLLELPFPPLQRATLYQADDQGRFEAKDIGYDVAMSVRKIAHRHFVFPITLEANKTRLFFINVMRKGGSVQAPLHVWSQQDFLMRDGSQNYIYGIFYGTLFAMILYNGFLYISLRSRTYLYYIIYISLSTLAYMALSGYGFLYLWPEFPAINTLIIPFICTVATVFGMVFFKSFSNVATRHKRLNLYLNSLIIAGALLASAIVISRYLLSLYVVIYIGITGTSALFASLYCWRKGSRQSGFFLLAWTLFIVGVLCFLGVLMGWIPSNFFTRHSLQLGCTTEVLLLSFGLADQINNERKAKYKALQEQHKAVVKLQEMESQLMHRALHSRSTGLPNRALLRRSLDEYFEQQYESGMVGLFLISLDNFHEFNKTLGHSTGDAILKLVTHRLSELIGNFRNAICFEVSDSDTHALANVEGVTFGFALKTSTRENALQQAEVVLQAFERPFEYQGMILDVESTIGISMYPEHGEGTDTLLRNAHIALEAAAVSSNKVAIYTSELDPYSAKRLSLIAELKAAMEQNSLQLYFQPQVDLRTQQVTGAEVLIRWIHSEHGFIPP
ncbi:MAG: 7TM diverse intracellular signaling domain-containing protein, partial [Ketobacteraceae bacterium]|nr:7TM diverse intracellular signaling domain-containing protein [Ketobacteraceae bacterium]